MIHTERCTIRPLVEADIDAVMVYRNDTLWMRYQGLKGLDRQGYIDRLIGNGFSQETGGQLAVVQRPAGALIGDLYVGLLPPVCRIGFTISSAYARQGYGFEAVGGLIDALRARPEITVVQAEADPDNAASIGLLAKLGFARVGTDDDSVKYELKIQ